MKALRRKNVEQCEQLAVKRVDLERISASEMTSVRMMEQRQLEPVQKYEERCRLLSARISDLEGGKLGVVETEARQLRDRNRALAQQVEHLMGPATPGPTHFDVLYDMAKCMNRMGKEEETVWRMRFVVCYVLCSLVFFLQNSDDLSAPPRITFQDHVKTLVKKCLEGSGVGQQGAASRQHEVFALLNAVYCAAIQRGEEVGIAERALRVGMVKIQRKRPRVEWGE